MPSRHPYYRVIAKAASYTLIPWTDSPGSLYVATAAATFTLPSPSKGLLGRWYDFATGADVNMTVAAPTADTLVTVNDLAADSVVFSTSSQKIGSLVRMICVTLDGGATYQWMAVNMGSTTMTVNT